MSRISSTLTFYYKRIFPLIWVGGCVLIGGLGLYAALSKGSGLFPLVIITPIIFVLGIYFMKKYVFDLVDEVLDDGDALVVKNNGQEQRIALADITNVSYAAMTSPPRVVLSLFTESCAPEFVGVMLSEPSEPSEKVAAPPNAVLSALTT